MKLARCLLIISILCVSGCAGTKLRETEAYTPVSGATYRFDVIETKPVTPEGMGVFMNRLNASIAEAGMKVESRGPDITVQINFTYYRMRHGAARAMVGAMAGSDGIITEVEVRDRRRKTVLGRFTVKSSNPSAWGTSRGLINGHADKIVAYIARGQR